MNPKTKKEKKSKNTILFIACDEDANISVWDSLKSAAKAANDVNYLDNVDDDNLLADGSDLCETVEDTLQIDSMKNKSVRKVTVHLEDLKLKKCPCGNGFIVL